VDSDGGSRRIAIRAWAAGAIVILVFLAFFAFRPTAILGVDGGALTHSVGGSLVSTSCRHLDADTWMCGRMDDQLSGQVSYRVEVHNLGCWSATRDGSPGEGSRKHISGCITIADYLLKAADN
jgi:hypothetical protein